MRVAEAVAEASARLAAAGVASPRVDAELLLAFVLGVPRTQLALAGELTAAQRQRYFDLVARRAVRVPLQHLTGRAPFRHLELSVGPGVFVPRPETEMLVEWALHRLRERVRRERVRRERVRRERGVAATVVDLCSGTGAIAAAIATEAPGTRVYAVEVDREALVWLRRTAGELPGAAAIVVVAGDATDPATLEELDGTVDLVISNPPYVPAAAADALPPEVTRHDPPVAVFGGADGLAVIRPLIGRAAALLRPGSGAFAVEHDETSAAAVATLLAEDGRFTDIRLHHDLAGRPRFTTAGRAE